jgi:hypothetical protein
MESKNMENNMEQEKLELKKQIITEQMAQFWTFCQDAQEKYNDGIRVIPDSVQEFSEKFFIGLRSVLEVI